MAKKKRSRKRSSGGGGERNRGVRVYRKATFGGRIDGFGPLGSPIKSLHVSSIFLENIFILDIF